MRITKLSKVLSLVLVICIAFGMIVTTNAEEVTTEVISEVAQDAEAVDVEAIDAEAEPEVEVINFDETYEFKFIERFNLMPCYNYDDFRVDEPVSRAEFASMLCTLGGFDPVTGGNQFVDIRGNGYEKQINAVTVQKLMVGYDKYTFLPDSGITLAEAVKPILILAGYENLANQQGGYPNGYMQIAGDLDMLDGLNITANDAVSRGDMARLIYNSRNVEIYNTIDFVDVEGETKVQTLMTKCLNIDCIRGLVKDNGITGLRSDEKSRIGYITIGNQQFKLRKQSEVRTYVGRYVEAYYTNKPDADGEKTIEYIHLDKVYSRDEITFDITKFISFSGRTLKFENEKEKEQKIELTSSVNYIYNNKAVKSINELMFNFDYGTVTYVPARKGAADTIIIEGFVSWFITGTDREFNYISTTKECQPIDGQHRLDLPVEEIGKNIFIEDYHGWDGDSLDISAYDVVDICKSGDYAYIKVTEPDIQEKTVKGKTKVDDKVALSFTDGDIYVVSPYYANTGEYNGVSIGTMYYVYRNIAGHIVRLENIANVDLKTAYLIRSYYDDVDEVGYLKVLTDAGKYQTLTVDEKITFSDNKNENFPSMLFKNAHFSNLDNYEGIINYTLNKAGLVKKIYLPVDIGVEREMGRLGCIFATEGGDDSLYWEKNRTNWGDTFISAADVGIFRRYTDETEMEKRYQYGPVTSFSVSYKVPMKAYGYEPNSLYADVIWQEYAKDTSSGNAIKESGTMMVVTDMSEEVIYGDETYVKIKAATLPYATEATYYIPPEKLKDVSDITLSSPEKYWDVEKGDLIIAETQVLDKSIIDDVVLMWDANADSPLDPENGRKGSVPANIGHIDSSNLGISNPFEWYAARNSPTAKWRSSFGYVYHIDTKGGLIVSSQELSSKTYDPNYDRTKHFQKVFLPPANTMVAVTYKDNQAYVRKASMTDVKTYLADGNNCSKVFVKTDSSKPSLIVIFNGEMK